MDAFRHCTTSASVASLRSLLCLTLALAPHVGSAKLLAADPKSAAPKAAGLEGIWAGSLKVSVTELRLVFNIKGKPDGSYTGTMDSLDQGAKGIPMSSITLKDAAVKIEAKNIGAIYEAKLNSAATEITGEWKQGGQPFPLTLKRQAKAPELRRPQVPVKPYPYDDIEVSYPNPKAGITLAGSLTVPRTKGPHPVVLLITGSGPQDRDETLLTHKPFLVLADHLTRKGVAVLRVDDRGVAKSTGNHGTATSADFATDVEAGIAFLNTRAEINPKQIGLIGHSEGGIIAPMVAARNSDVAFIVLMAGTGLTGEEILYLQGAAILQTMGAPPAQLARQREMQKLMFKVVKEEKDNTAAEKKLNQVLDAQKAKMTQEEQKELTKQKAAVGAQFRALLSPWFRYFMVYDPRPALRNVRCSVLALNGDKDVQVDAKANLSEIAKALKEGHNADFTIKEFPNLNHLFQTCKTGSVAEYGQIEETIAPVALQAMSDWILQHTKPAPETVAVAAQEASDSRSRVRPFRAILRRWLRGR